MQKLTNKISINNTTYISKLISAYVRLQYSANDFKSIIQFINEDGFLIE